jgi:kynurenine formamidase
MNKRWVKRPDGSNWGDFGPDDQRGRMNLVTPEKVRQGVAEVKQGRSFCLSLPLNLPGGNAVNPKRHPPVLGPVYEKGETYYNFIWKHHLAGSRDVTSDESVTLYSQYSTQWDGFAHVGMLFDADGDGEAEPVYYNGYRAHEHIGGAEGSGQLGAKALGIENMATTCVQGRAVLADFHAHFGDERVAVGYDTLMSVFDKDGIVVEAGDMFLFHTGWDDLITGMGGEPDAEKLHASCAVLDGFDPKLLEWITDSGISIIATDNMAVEDSRSFGDTRDGPSRLPLHRHCLFRLGIHLGELWYLSELAAALKQQRRSRFLLTAPPLRMPGAVGSPVTPVATI